MIPSPYLRENQIVLSMLAINVFLIADTIVVEVKSW